MEVPGLVEKRPQLIKGDRVQIKLKVPESNVAYEGIISRIDCNWITIEHLNTK